MNLQQRIDTSFYFTNKMFDRYIVRFNMNLQQQQGTSNDAFVQPPAEIYMEGWLYKKGLLFTTICNM